MRTPKLPIRKHESGRYCFDLPPAMSSTGRRERRFFPTKGKAELERLAALERFRIYGTEGRSVRPTAAADAERAREALKDAGLDVSLFDLAKDFIERHRLKTQSVPLSELLRVFRESREKKSEVHQRNIRKAGERLLEALGDKTVSEIDHAELRDAVSAAYPTAHGFNFCYRTLNPAFKMAVREGWSESNPFEKIETRDTGRHQVKIPPLNSIRKLMTSFADYSEDKAVREDIRVDCRGAVAAIALMTFCGVRPGGEIKRLHWEQIDLEEGTAFIENVSAKVDRSRMITMTPTAVAWLRTVPREERRGRVVPTDWKRCWQALRQVSGIGEYTDGLRKACATAHLLAFGDVAQTRALVGHEVGQTIFNNYIGKMSKRDALAYWKILPDNTAGLEAVAG